MHIVHRTTNPPAKQSTKWPPRGRSAFFPLRQTPLGKPLNNSLQNGRLPLQKILAKAKFLSKSEFVCFFSSPLVRADRKKTEDCSDQAAGITQC